MELNPWPQRYSSAQCFVLHDNVTGTMSFTIFWNFILSLNTTVYINLNLIIYFSNSEIMFVDKQLTIITRFFFSLLKTFGLLKGTLMQIRKSSNFFVFTWRWYVEDFTLKHLLCFEMCARDICEKFVYKHSETIE